MNREPGLDLLVFGACLAGLGVGLDLFSRPAALVLLIVGGVVALLGVLIVWCWR